MSAFHSTPSLPLKIRLICDPRIVATLEKVFRDGFRVSVFYNNCNYGTLRQAFSAVFAHKHVEKFPPFLLLNGWHLWEWANRPLLFWRDRLVAAEEEPKVPWVTCFDNHINSDGVFGVEEYTQWLEYTLGTHKYYGQDGPIGHFLRLYCERPHRNTGLDSHRKDPIVLQWYKYDIERRGWWAKVKNLPGPVFFQLDHIRPNMEWVQELVRGFSKHATDANVLELFALALDNCEMARELCHTCSSKRDVVNYTTP